MVDTPNPVTTEWVPVWNLGVAGVIGLHAPTHGTGGSDPITDLPASVLTSGLINNARLPVWSAYTPIWTAEGGGHSIGNGTLVGRHTVIGKTCHFTLQFNFGSTSTAGTGRWVFTVPFPRSGVFGIFKGVMVNGAAIRSVVSFPNPDLSSFYPIYQVDGGSMNFLSGAAPAAPVAGDVLRISGTYEIA